MTNVPNAIRSIIAHNEQYSYMYSDEFRRGGEDMARLITFLMMMKPGEKEWKELHEELEKKIEANNA